MAPLPFPFAFNVGTDICNITRIYRLLTSNLATGRPLRFLSRVLLPGEIRDHTLTRTFAEALARSRDARAGSDTYKGGSDSADGSQRLKANDEVMVQKWRDLISHTKNNGSRSKHGKSLSENLTPDPHSARDGNTQEVGIDEDFWKLASLVAGRWACKEAVIKAHSKRKLYMDEIWIQRQQNDRNGSSSAPKVTVLARKKGFDLGPVETRIGGSEAKVEAGKSDTMLSELWKHGRECKCSISHDGTYATAVCIALDEEGAEVEFNSLGEVVKLGTNDNT